MCVGWNELLIAGFSHRSIDTREGLVLAQGVIVYRNTAHQAGIGSIFDRVLSELVTKMRDMGMDKAELGCLRAIILFNPGTHIKILTSSAIILIYNFTMKFLVGIPL